MICFMYVFWKACVNRVLCFSTSYKSTNNSKFIYKQNSDIQQHAFLFNSRTIHPHTLSLIPYTWNLR